eukprot:CAMPEP_0197653226 /NCGR_PEP_ID=MMETSP1338-20131121/34927_1 /TAXON_ID=43686 ORGANISM="Pelagodinium beii, Strain RCC1491" /NCGR_SAMPLE_ID=MMETSP1338 /ASSEMBLY_ACC=CAM_ASM_000754 /LENGTH=499 /DNA_ID=CAMNT_0043228263 /DNA_START=33 /DNA_END=1532 /DNA_ORIENTATION=+
MSGYNHSEASVAAAQVGGRHERGPSSGTHKGPETRTLTVARKKLDDAIAVDNLPKEAKEILLEVEALLRAADCQINAPRLARFHGSREAEDLIKDVPTTESQREILLNWTELDPEVAAMHEVICRSPTKRAHRGMTMTLSSPSGEAQKFLERAGHFDFDALGFAEVCEVPVRGMGGHLMVSSDLIKDLCDAGWLSNHEEFQRRMCAFLAEVDRLYSPTATYHGAAHAIDAMGTVAWFLSLEGFAERFTRMDHLVVYVAAGIHDVGHPGTNNLFHSKTMSELAIRYNDRSVLENFHVALAFETLQKPALNWFTLLEKDFHSPDSPSELHVDLQQYVRRGLISMVLATDMAKHATQLQDLKNVVEAEKKGFNPEVDKQRALENKLLLLETVLHAADISNPWKPQKIMLAWTHRVLDEFWAQGDQEQTLGLPISPLCDREAGVKSVPKGQLGFINFVIVPYLNPIVDLVPEAREAMQQLEENKQFWELQDKESAGYEQIFPE